MLLFLSGLMIGGFLGVTAMALMVAASRADDHMDRKEQ